ncbi:uncharacterized protein LOC129282805 isoform X3 [Lytechinus pictus]|uniref:uncharacterized protein LOC129282805 isoform X1 n=1 Tax=Lytechinus pictus TaxID=7653 RepID=UPI0030B9F0E1
MKALIVLLSVICLVTTVTGQYHDNYTYVAPAPSSEYDEHYTSNQPGELVPHSGFTVQFLIEAAGRLWQQNSVFEAMTFACEGVLPVIGSMIDEVDQSSLYWGVFCDNVTRVKSVSEFNGERWCNDIIDTVTGMFGNDGQDEGRYRRQAPDESSLESPFGILENLLNTTRDLYGIDILMIIQNVSTINTICTDVTENFIRPSPKQVITDFAAELIVRLLPEVCQTWDSFFEAVGLNSSSQTYRVILGLVDAGSDAVGYSNFDELCHDINQTVQDDDLDERRRIAELIIRNFIGILENGDQCSTLAKKIMNAIWTLTNCGNSDPYSSPYGLEYQFYMFTGFHSIEEMCYDVAEALTTAVELPRARLATLIPGTNLTFPFFVNAVGGAWQQDRLIDVLAYACSDILPAITTMVPEIRSFSFLFEPICRQLRSAARDLEDFDSTGYCNELTDMVTALLPSAPVSNDSIGDPGEGGGADSMDDPLGILNALMNVTLELYNINIFDPSTICPNIEGLLRKPFPAILLEFGGEMMSRFLPLALQPLCRLDSFLEQFGVNSSSPFYDIIQEAVRLASRAVGYEQREQLCAQIVGVVHKGHEKRLRFSKDIIKELFRIPFNADTCDSLLSGAIRRVVRPLLTEVIPGSGRLIRISDYLISRFSGYRNVYDFCNHLETAFKSEVPLPRPAFGEIISGSDLTISLLINLAGSLWSQESTMESLDYVCTHVLPVITRTVPEFREARVLLRPFCDVIESAGNQFDATDVCLDLVGETWELISFLTPQSREDLYTCPTQETTTHHGDEHIDVPDVYQNESYSIETVEDVSFVLALLVNISETFNIDIANLTTICPLAPRLLRPRLPDVIKDFGSEIFSFLLPLAEPICHNFTLFLDSTLASFGVNSSSPFYHIIQDAVRIASKLVEYPTIEELCGDIVQKLADFQDFDDNNRLDFTMGIINSLMELTTNVDRCTQISTDILVFIVEPLINIGNEGERFNITLDLIHTYTGFRGVEPICQAMQTAFDGCASPRQADIDACGECIRRPSVGNIDYHFVSNHADCTGRCPREQDGTNGPAELNSCLRCVGGSTWRPTDAGMNECGTCGFLAGFDCVGCDGQINSGLEFDACDICGGDGSDCTAVSSIVPEIIPSGGEYEITAHGGGLRADPAHVCRFSLRNGDTVHEFTLAASQSYVGTCTVNNLPAGTYDFSLLASGTDPMNTSITLQVYDPIDIDSVSPEEFTLVPNSDITLTFTAASNAFQAIEEQGLTPYLAYERDGMAEFLPGEVGGDAMQELIFTGRAPDRPLELVTKLTFNKRDDLPGGPFTVTFYQPPPVIASFAFYPLQNILLLEFEEGVRIDGTLDCSTIFELPSDRNILGTGSTCTLFRRARFIKITLGTLDVCGQTGLITTADTLTVRGDVILGLSDFSRALPETILEVNVENAITLDVVLSGRHMISSCGRVNINAGRTKKNGLNCRPVNYIWSVQSDDDVSEALSAAVTRNNSGVLDIDGSLLTEDQAYEFTLEVGTYLGTYQSEHFSVTRSAEAVPDISILPPDIDLENVPLSKRFVLKTKVTFYADCVGGGPARTEYQWTVNKNNFEGKILGGITDKNRLTIIPYGYTFTDDNYDVTFTVEATFEGIATPLTSSITVRFAPSDLVATIKGASRKSVGVDVGPVSLDGSLSYDPDIPRNEDQSSGLTYLWTCVQGADQLCINAQDGSNFPPAADSTSAVLNANANYMVAGETYTLTLEVSSGSRRASTSVVIEALAGTPPPVTLAIPVFRFLSLSSTDAVPLVTVIGDRTRPVTDISSISTFWRLLVDDDEDVGYEFDTGILVERSFGIIQRSEIAAGDLDPGQLYNVQVEVDYGQAQPAIAQLELQTPSGVSSCDLSGNDYTELDEVSFTVDNCVTGENDYPLTYQLFYRNSNGVQRSLGIGESVRSIRGPPSSANGNGNNVFFAKVCNQAQSCYTTGEVTLTVGRLQSINYQQLKLSLVDAEINKGDILSALRNLNHLVSSLIEGQSRKRRQTVSIDQSTTDQFALFQDAASAPDIDEDTAGNLIDEATFINVAALPTEDLTTFVVLLKDLVSVFPDTYTVLSDITYQSLTGIIQDIGEATEDDSILNLVRELVVGMTLSAIDRNVLGSPGLESNLAGVASKTNIIIPEGVYHASSGVNASTVDFGTELAERYTLWTCGDGTGDCQGILVQMNQYATGVDPYSTDNDDRDNLASSILEITFYDQWSENLDVVEVASLTEPISINMHLSAPEPERSYECAFWDNTTNQWSRTGVETVMTTTTSVECRTSHLSVFAVFAGEEIVPTSGPSPVRGNKLGIIIGCVVGGLVVIVIIVILIVVCTSKSKKVGSTDKEMGIQLTHGGTNGSGNEHAYDNPQKSGPPPLSM